MSLDLLKEFGAPRDSIRSQKATQSTAKGPCAEEDDFGEFEDAEAEIDVPTAQLGPFDTRVQACSVEKLADFPHDDDAWDDSVTESVLFDAEETVRTREALINISDTSEKVPQKPLAVTLAPIVPGSARTASTLDDFESGSATKISQTPIIPYHLSGKSTTPIGIATDNSGPKDGMAEVENLGPPPSNIPPPSILLPLVSTIFQSMSGHIKAFATHQRVPSDLHEPLEQARVKQLQGVLSNARASARILAGRKLRWKRDTILSQSMKIGPAGGKTHGMKLVGVDKVEARREDQEATEVLRTWKQQVGPLRSILSTITVHHDGGSVSIPEISEAMPIHVIKAGEGAVTAPKCCFLCGVKRDERIAKVDVDVEDSFGEWWMEHWGHMDCVAFWFNHKSSLRQR